MLVNGVDVREQELEQLWSALGLVPQAAYLFSGTVASNLRFGNADATDAELWHALEVAQASDFVSTMPGGLDAAIDQGGTNVSGGQRQRLSIARALVKAPPVYLFDDCFSALDAATDARLRAALRDETRDAAVLIVAQRVSTIMHADRIIVLDEGRVVGMGTHQELRRDLRSLSRDRRLPARRGRRSMMGRPGGGMRMGAMGAGGAPLEKSKDFWGTLRRLLRRLGPDRFRILVALGLRRGLGRVHRERPEDPRQRDERALQRRDREALASGGHEEPGDRLASCARREPDRQHDLGDERYAREGRRHRTSSARCSASPLSSTSPGAAFNYGQGYLLAGVAQRAMFGLRREVEEKLARLPLRYFDSHPHGDILSRVTNDIDNLTTTVQQGLSQLLTSILTICGVLGMMFWISPILAAVSAVTIPLAIVVTFLIARRSQVQFAHPVGSDRRPERSRRRDPHRTLPRPGLRTTDRPRSRSSPGRTNASTRRAFARSSFLGSSSPRCSSSPT